MPTGIVMSVPDILAHPQIIHRDLLKTFDEHNNEILRELGYTENEISEFKKTKVI